MTENEKARTTVPKAVLPGGRSPQGEDRKVPRGRHGHPRAEIEMIQRARILDAFVNEVGTAGLTGAHVAHICAAAGVSTKEFYSVFRSKDECFFAAFDLGAGVICDQVATTYEETKGLWEDRIRAAIFSMLQSLASNPAYARLSIVEIYQAGEHGLERLNTVIQRFREILGGGAPNPPPGLPGEAFENTLVGLAFHPLAEYVMAGKAAQLTDLVPVLTYSLALPVVGPERAARQLHPSIG
jgi:AcrR family transcriptional regulator